ncbi:primase-like DNA-binding domain-containing protein [Arthrobacter sp. APC 3897]|uniref:primase-like DNA-binding domain-containing protein n=1 Tax=Arthrobacter sp. APC 3897 TaxID=3035204 RepID=UPI0025B5B8C5|nr:primase-like DNA-binding domain-containing protein [Arthrobacter sp. APC 3897]MDN3482463.1 primase-like DNA-binding domain-containing protein [Arthrobacter sp. APC 3897]
MAEQNLDHIVLFLDECTLAGLDESASVPAADLYGMYMVWCENAGREPAPVHHFYGAVRGAGHPEVTRRSERVYEGVQPTGPIPIQYIMETDKAPGPNTNPFPFSG